MLVTLVMVVASWQPIPATAQDKQAWAAAAVASATATPVAETQAAETRESIAAQESAVASMTTQEAASQVAQTAAPVAAPTIAATQLAATLSTPTATAASPTATATQPEAAVQSAGVEAETRSVEASFRDGSGSFIMYSPAITVSGNLASDYGLISAEDEDGQATVLDALVAMHVAKYGDSFTKENASDYITYSGGMITKAFGEENSGNFGFAVNGICPNDGVYVPEWGCCTGYGIADSVLADGDDVCFWVYRDLDSYGDQYARFRQDETVVNSISATAGASVTVNVQGYNICWYGSNTQNKVAGYYLGVPGVQLGLYDPATNSVQAIDGAITDEDGTATITFSTAGTYWLTTIGNDEFDMPVIAPLCEVVVTGDSGGTGDGTDTGTGDGTGTGTGDGSGTGDGGEEQTPVTPQFPDMAGTEISADFENDLLLQYDYKSMQVGDTASIYPRRIPQIISNAVANDVARPNFHFEVVSGDSVELSAQESTESVRASAVKAGTSIVKVTYDAMEYKGTTYGACAEQNAGYILYEVGDKGSVSISTDIAQSSFDTIYFTQGDSVALPFNVKADGATSVQVSCNGVAIAANADGSYTADLIDAQNVIYVTALDAQGRVTSYSKTVQARKIVISVENSTNPDQAIHEGDTVKVSFTGISNPVPKLAGIFNPTWYSPSWDCYGTYVQYCNETIGEMFGRCQQWNLATNNSFEFTVPAAGDYTFTSKGIYSQWWGEELAAASTLTTAPTNTSASTHEDWFCIMPDFTVTVAEAGSEGTGGEGEGAGSGDGSGTSGDGTGAGDGAGSGTSGDNSTGTSGDSGTGESADTDTNDNDNTNGTGAIATNAAASGSGAVSTVSPAAAITAETGATDAAGQTAAENAIDDDATPTGAYTKTLSQSDNASQGESSSNNLPLPAAVLLALAALAVAFGLGWFFASRKKSTDNEQRA